VASFKAERLSTVGGGGERGGGRGGGGGVITQHRYNMSNFTVLYNTGLTKDACAASKKIIKIEFNSQINE
jgi:hypothetical protein